MRDPSASVESTPASLSTTRYLPDAGLVTAAWTDPSPGNGLVSRPDKAKSLSGAMLALGAALLYFVPVGGVCFLVAGGLGLAIAMEAPTAAQPKPSSAPTNE